MNPTKSLVTGAVALSAFASVLGVAYAQVENTDPQTQQQYQTQSTDQSIQSDQTMQQAEPAPQAEPATTPPADQQWNQDAASQQEPLPSDPTAAGTPEPRADRN